MPFVPSNPEVYGIKEQQVVLHRTEPEPMTVDVEVGVSASGKPFHTVKVRNATDPTAAVNAVQDALNDLEFTADKLALDKIATILREYDPQAANLIPHIWAVLESTGREE